MAKNQEPTLSMMEERPLVTFALFAYNQEKYIREAVEGALSQTYEPLEIILSDDCSCDQTFEIMQDMAAVYEGPHDVKLRKNKTNLGLGEHVSDVFSIAKGDVLLLAAGDDVSLPDRTQISINILSNNQDATAALLSADVVNESGEIIGERIVSSNKNWETIQTIDDLINGRHVTFGATRAIRRHIFSHFGAFSNKCPTEDTTLLFRSLICGSNVLSPRKGILYRKHRENISNPGSLASMNVEAIYDQYRADIAFAEQSDILDKGLAIKLFNWTKEDQRLRQVKLEIALKKHVNMNDTLFYMMQPSIKFKSKLAFFIRNLMRSWRGANSKKGIS